ncbi:MAG: helix-turn-helix domain-containing protein, partial [Pseudonocardia sp.]|nr:helix-turn-helix domain-containing protein [Pseudonocardia sp.]
MTSSQPDVLLPQWTLDDRLRKVRRLLKLEQREMAERLEVGRQAYAAWEAGRSTPRDIVALARRVELLAGVPAAWTLGVLDGGVPVGDVPAAAAIRAPKITAVSADLGKGINPHCSPSAATRRIV